ncbi:ser/Thr protein phosphatase family protein [Ustulina deusta]|nr:ser/Thr protein phosphatase family protein [Ustulina deusta]KAI3338557.1 ser/Thr protein phosphatase family protein [Ustulina deusta]
MGTVAKTTVKTRVLIISDTHGEVFKIKPEHKADVVIHCGDLTDQSKLDEYHRTLQLLKDLDAPLKLVIAGNHDFTLDTPAFERKVNEATELLEPELVRREYGDYGEARRLFDEAPGIAFLDEGTHTFRLHNGALLTVYASPYTPSAGGNAFQYHPNTGHQFAIGRDTDIVITHGPPRGIMDRTDQGRAGCTDLFAAVARAQPQLHCFGHIHEDWGAKLVAWRWRGGTTDTPSHFTDIDNNHSTVIDTLKHIIEKNSDAPNTRTRKLIRAEQYTQQGYCVTSCCQEDRDAMGPNAHTLFVNAAVEGVTDSFPMHPPWIVDIDLPSH